MDRLSRVLLQVDTNDPASQNVPVHLVLQLTVLGQRLVVLRDLITFRDVGIRVVLPVKLA
jgi:hypothetical protein